MTEIKVKRTYDDAAAEDGFRILVDRLWPRGLSKEKFHYDLWEKDLAPSTRLREWYHADTEGRAGAFDARYEAELNANPALPAFVRTVREHPVVTFLYSSKDRKDNNAKVLRKVVMQRLGEG